MPKANLHISKRSDKVIDIIETYGFSRVKDWTRRELLELQKNSRLPIIIALQNGDYLVATYRVEKISEICWRVKDLDFTDKRSSIFYCVLMHLGKSAVARELYRLDQYVGQLDLDKSIFRVRLDAAHNSGDLFKIDLYSSRYEESKGKLRYSKQELENLIVRAKYSISHLLTGK